MFMHIRLICVPIKFTYLLTYLLTVNVFAAAAFMLLVVLSAFLPFVVNKAEYYYQADQPASTP